MAGSIKKGTDGLWSSSLGRSVLWLAKASVYRLQVSLSCTALCHIVSPQYLSMSSLHRLAGLVSLVIFSCRMVSASGDTRGPSVVFKAVDVPCPGPLNFFTLLIMSMTFVLSLTQVLALRSLYVMLSILLSTLICAAASLAKQ